MPAPISWSGAFGESKITAMLGLGRATEGRDVLQGPAAGPGLRPEGLPGRLLIGHDDTQIIEQAWLGFH
jgi:hypothetical protein